MFDIYEYEFLFYNRFSIILNIECVVLFYFECLQMRHDREITVYSNGINLYENICQKKKKKSNETLCRCACLLNQMQISLNEHFRSC